MPEFIDPVFAKTSPKRSFLVIENERFRLVFAKAGSLNSGTDLPFRNTSNLPNTYSTTCLKMKAIILSYTYIYKCIIIWAHLAGVQQVPLGIKGICLPSVSLSLCRTSWIPWCELSTGSCIYIVYCSICLPATAFQNLCLTCPPPLRNKVDVPIGLELFHEPCA